MENQPYTFDLYRIFIGDGVNLFFLEILLRTVVMYLYTFGLIRFLGKREVGTLSTFEFVIVIALGSAVGDPMFYPDVPVLHGLAVITVVVVFQRILVDVTNTSPRFERWLEGSPHSLVEDGVVNLENLRHERLSATELFTALRVVNCQNLGQIYRAFLEPSGEISVFFLEEAQPGLTLLPATDKDYPSVQEAGTSVSEAGTYACAICGRLQMVEKGDTLPGCNDCENSAWVKAERVERNEGQSSRRRRHMIKHK